MNFCGYLPLLQDLLWEWLLIIPISQGFMCPDASGQWCWCQRHELWWLDTFDLRCWQQWSRDCKSELTQNQTQGAPRIFVFLHAPNISENAFLFGSPLLKALIANGSHIDAIDDEGWTALMRAAFWGYEDVVKVLIGAGTCQWIGSTIFWCSTPANSCTIIDSNTLSNGDLRSETGICWIFFYHLSSSEYSGSTYHWLSSGTSFSLIHKICGCA